jgi:hypothetical protein
MERGWSRGQRSESAGRRWKTPEPTRETRKTGSAHWPPVRGGTEGNVERGAAGFPEQRAPEQGTGRSPGISRAGVGIPAARPRSAWCATPEFHVDREITYCAAHWPWAVEGKTIPIVRNARSAPNQGPFRRRRARSFIPPRTLGKSICRGDPLEDCNSRRNDKSSTVN